MVFGYLTCIIIYFMWQPVKFVFATCLSPDKGTRLKWYHTVVSGVVSSVLNVYNIIAILNSTETNYGQVCNSVVVIMYKPCGCLYKEKSAQLLVQLNCSLSPLFFR